MPSSLVAFLKNLLMVVGVEGVEGGVWVSSPGSALTRRAGGRGLGLLLVLLLLLVPVRREKNTLTVIKINQLVGVKLNL